MSCNSIQRSAFTCDNPRRATDSVVKEEGGFVAKFMIESENKISNSTDNLRPLCFEASGAPSHGQQYRGMPVVDNDGKRQSWLITCITCPKRLGRKMAKSGSRSREEEFVRR